MVSKSARQGPSGRGLSRWTWKGRRGLDKWRKTAAGRKDWQRARALTYDLVPKRGDAIGVVAFLGGNHLLGGLDACSPARGGELVVVHMVLFFVPPNLPSGRAVNKPLLTADRVGAVSRGGTRGGRRRRCGSVR